VRNKLIYIYIYNNLPHVCQHIGNSLESVHFSKVFEDLV